jgi:hypothetical protein
MQKPQNMKRRNLMTILMMRMMRVYTVNFKRQPFNNKSKRSTVMERRSATRNRMHSRVPR